MSETTKKMTFDVVSQRVSSEGSIAYNNFTKGDLVLLH